MGEPTRAEDGSTASAEEGPPTELVEDSENTVLAPPALTSAMPDGWRPPLGEVPSAPITRVHSLGDLHGWAPGLITYLIEKQMATVEVNDLALYKIAKGGRYEPDNDNLRSVFPEPHRHFDETGAFPPAGLKGQWLDNNRQTTRPEGHYSVKAEWVCKDPGTAFVQIGDVFDRSDHSELACEILRQLIIQAPLRVFVLVGNHEQFFLENDKRTWHHNEKRYEFGKERGLDSHGFQTRTCTEGFDRVYFLYSCSASLLYMTQGAIMEYAKNGGEVEDWILDGGFEGATSAHEIITNKKKGEKIHGAIVTLLLGHTIFAHAEPNAFMSDRTADTVLTRLKDGRHSASKTRMALDEYVIGNSIQDSLHSDLLWSRGAEIGITDSTPKPFKAIESMRRAIASFPGLRHYVHGHSVVPNSRLQSKRTSNPVSYLARRLEAPNPEVGSVRIHMIDSGICPVYHQGDQGIFDPSRVPVGLGLTAALVKFQDPEDEKVESAESNSKLWLVNHTADDSTEVFTIPPSLTALIPTKIGSLDKGGVRVSMSDAWNEEGDRFEMEGGGSILIPSVKGLGKDNQVEFVICNGDVNYARALRSTKGERIEMDRAVLAAGDLAIDENMTGGLDAIDPRLNHADPDQWFEVLPMLRVRLSFHRGALLLDASSSMEDAMYLHIASLSQDGFNGIVEIPPKTRFKKKLDVPKSNSSKAAWFVGLGKSPSETLGAHSSNWSGGYVDDVVGLKQVLNSDIGDVLRIVLKTNRPKNPPSPRKWKESESTIEEAEEGTVLVETVEEEESIRTDDKDSAPSPSSQKIHTQEKESPSKQSGKRGTPFRGTKTLSPTSTSKGIPIKETKKKSIPTKSKLRQSKWKQKSKEKTNQREREKEGRGNLPTKQPNSKSPPNEDLNALEKVIDKAKGVVVEGLDVLTGSPYSDESPSSPSFLPNKTYIRVKFRGHDKKWRQLFDRPSRGLERNLCRLDEPPKRIPAWSFSRSYFRNWHKDLTLSFNKDFFADPFKHCILKPRREGLSAGAYSTELQWRMNGNEFEQTLTIKRNPSSDQISFKIKFLNIS